MANMILGVLTDETASKAAVYRRVRRLARSGAGGIDTLSRKLNELVEAEIIPQMILEQMGVRPAFAAKTVPASRAWKARFANRPLPKSLNTTAPVNLIISIDSVSAEPLIRFVRRNRTYLKQGSITVLYRKSGDEIRLRRALRLFENKINFRFRRVTHDLKTAAFDAYQEYKNLPAVVVAPGPEDFDAKIPAYRRLILNSASLLESGMPELTEDILKQIAIPLAGIGQDAGQEMARFLTAWREQGFRGILYNKEGVAPNLELYIQYVASQVTMEHEAKRSA